MKNILLSLSIIFIMMFSACLKSGENNYEIHNESHVPFFFGWVMQGDSFDIVVDTNAQVVFYNENGLGVEVPATEEFLSFFDAIYINVNDTLSCIKDLEAYSNWQHSYQGQAASHTLIIQSEDIQ